MEQNDIQIIGCKVAKKVSMDYYDHRDGYNYSVDNTEYPHPDLVNAVKGFKNHLAESHYILGGEMDNFSPNGFQIHETKGVFSVIVTGKLTTLHDDKVAVSSGKIPIDEGNVEELLTKLRGELYKYFFDGKSAQAKLFEGDDKNLEGKEKPLKKSAEKKKLTIVK